MFRWLLVPLLAVPSVASADPLRAIPASVTLVSHAGNPRKLAEAVTGLDLFGQYAALPQLKAALDSPTARRAFQLLAHVEKSLGAKWPELLEQLAGNGVALGSIPNADPAPVVLAMEGKDEKAVAAGFKLALELIAEEVTRQAGSATPVSPPRGTHNGADTVNLDQLHAARAGKFVLVASSAELLHAAIDRVTGKGEAGSIAADKGFAEARRLLPANPLASLWFNLKPVKETKAGKDFFEATRKDFLQTMVAGGTIDAVRRSDFVTVGLFETPKGLRLSLRMPAKRDGLPKEFGLHLPPAPDTPGTLPLLEPPGVLYSQSLHLDLAAMWKDRKKLFNEQALKDIEEGVKNVSRVLPNTSVEKLLLASGPHHRFVAVERGQNQYAVKPGTPLPEMALVSTTRGQEFAAGASTTLRAAGLLASLQFKLKMSEETHDGVRIVSYRFPEKGDYPGDDDNYRFNFVPSFASTDTAFIAATSPKLVKDLLAELKKPTKTSDNSAALWRGKLYGSGAAGALRARPDAVISTAVLSRGIGLTQAKGEVAALAKFLESMGNIGFNVDHATDAFQFDVEWVRK